MTRGQVSIELFIIISLVMAIFIPLLLLVYTQMLQSGEQVALSEANIAVSRLALSVDEVAGSGGESRLITEIRVVQNPGVIRNATARGHEITLVLQTSAGTTELVKRTNANITQADITALTRPGTYQLEIKSVANATGPTVTIFPRG